MAKNFNTNTDNNDTWLTPPDLIKSLGEFDLDPCTPENMPWQTAKKMLSKERDGDGLTAEWNGRVWCNPPYGRETFKWLEKLADHGSGIALIFARTETEGFQKYVFKRANSVFFFKGRLRFHRADGSQGGAANAPSCLVSYSSEDTMAIYSACERGEIKGALFLTGLMKCHFNKKQPIGAQNRP